MQSKLISLLDLEQRYFSVHDVFYCDNRYTSSQGQKSLLHKYLLKLRAFVFSSGLNNESHYKKHNSKYGQCYSQVLGKINEKITSKTYSKNSLRDVTEINSCKFSMAVMDSYHIKLYSLLNVMSNILAIKILVLKGYFIRKYHKICYLSIKLFSRGSDCASK